MLKRAAAYLLSFCIVFSMFVQFVPSVFAQEITPWSNPELYVECKADFATEDKAEPGMAFQSFICVADPASVKYDDLYGSGATALPLVYETEVKDIKVVIKDYYISDDDMLWFKVEAAAGSTMPATLQQNPWVMYMVDEYDFPSLLIEEPQPTATPTATPTAEPTATPTVAPSAEPTATPTVAPTATPTAEPSATPTAAPTATPTVAPSATPTAAPSATPTVAPTATPTVAPTATPTVAPTATPTPDGDSSNITPPQLDPQYQIEEINRKGYFEKENVTFYKNPMGTSYTVTLATADLPQRVDVAYKVTDTSLQTPVSWYLLANTQSWQGIESWQYCYVLVEDVILADDEPETDPAVQQAFERLMATTTVDEFEELRAEIGIEIFRQFTTEQLDQINQHYNAMVEAETLTYETEVKYKGVDVPVTVTGLIPQGLTLSVHAASDETVLNGGFNVKKAEDIALALDIKLLDADSNEWQPKAGRTVIVSMGVTALGYQDGRIFQLEHKHGETIYKYDMTIVIDGKIRVATNGFSAYTVSAPQSTTGQANRVNNDGSMTMQVGQEKVYYIDNLNWGGNGRRVGTWSVTDPDGAIYYEVYTTTDRTESIYGVYGAWLRVIALKETTSPIELSFKYANVPNGWTNGDGITVREETYTLNITPPISADGVTKQLYLKDTINTTGCITATLVDGKGQEITDGLDGAKFEWTRKDEDQAMFIVPQAYENNNRSINVARDHGGLLEALKKADGTYGYTTYYLTATLADGSTYPASYTVYYPSEIINARFEIPKVNMNQSDTPAGAGEPYYRFFVNGTPGLYWKTTAPGQGHLITRDIEIVNPNRTSENFGPTLSADDASDGRQFVEVNAENFGALYQDIITAPGEEMVWSFYHAARSYPSWDGMDEQDYGSVSNQMYVVIGATENAQKITANPDTQQSKLLNLINLAKAADAADANIDLADGDFVEVTDETGTYSVWYSNRGTYTGRQNYNNTPSANKGWNEIEGKYKIPENQYRTRLFFVSDPARQNNGNVNDNSKNTGNLIDSAKAGHYRKFLIEYYEESYVEQDGTYKRELMYRNGKVAGTNRDITESGEGLMYSSQELLNYNYFEIVQHDYLGKILINGQNYPYSVRYLGHPALYIDNYPGEAKVPTDLENKDDHPSSSNSNYYEQYDIVMQVFFTDTMISAEKTIQFPTELTVEQKLGIIKDLSEGYQAAINLTDKKPGDTEFCNIDYTFNIKGPDPAGAYKAYTVLGDDHRQDDKHTFKELSTTELPGLTLAMTEYTVYHFSRGAEIHNVTDPKDPRVYSWYKYADGSHSENVSGNMSVPVHLATSQNIDSAQIHITNIYEEKQVTVTYEAVGNGKVSWKGKAEPDYKDSPTETVKFYSGDPIGASVHAADNATFAGWYKDKECTIPITAADGKYIAKPEDVGTGDKLYDFEPNIHVINEESVTFYAKFVTRSLTVEREVTAADIGQTFVYYIKGSEGSNVDMYITMEVKPEDIKTDGKGKISRTIYEVPSGRYDVVQLKDWSWRYDPEEEQSVQHIGTASNELEKKVIFNKPRTIEKWLSGLSEIAHNIGGKGGTT